MKEFVFVWVLSMLGPNGDHYFETKKACDNYRTDIHATYGATVPKCHKVILVGREQEMMSWIMPQTWDSGSIVSKNLPYYQAQPDLPGK